MHCYFLQRSLAFNIGLFKNEKKLKCPLEHIFTVFKVPFLQQEGKKRHCRGREMVYCLFLFSFFFLKLSQKAKGACIQVFFLSKSTLAAKHVLKDQTLYIYLFIFLHKENKRKKWISCVTETSTKPLFYKLQWLCNGATPQCKDKDPF